MWISVIWAKAGSQPAYLVPAGLENPAYTTMSLLAGLYATVIDFIYQLHRIDGIRERA